MNLLEESLSNAKKKMSNFEILFCEDYGDYYYFYGIYKNGDPTIRNGLAFNKKDGTLKKDWSSVNLVLDVKRGDINLDPYLTGEQKELKQKILKH